MRRSIPWLLMIAVCSPLVFSACTVEREVDFMAGTPAVQPGDLFGPGIYVSPAEGYAQIGSYGFPGVAAENGDVFFTSVIEGTRQLFRLSQRNWPLQLTFLPDGIDWYVPSHEGKLIIVGASPSGCEQTRLYLVETASGRIRPLTDNPNAVYGSVVWNVDDRSIFLSSNEENGTDFKLYRLELATGEAIKVLDMVGQNSWEDISPDGSWMIVSHGNPAVDNTLLLYDLSTGDTTRLTDADNPARYRFARFDAEGERLYLTSDANGRELMLRAVIDIDDEKISFSEPDSPWNVDFLALSPSREIMAWVTNRDGYSHMDVVNLKSGKELPSPRLNGVISEPTLTESSPVYFVCQSSTHAPGIWSWDWQIEELSPLTETAYAGIDTTGFVEPKPVTYGSFDGVQIPSWLYLPAGYTGKPLPFVVYLHDGPGGQSRPEFDATVQFLISRGYGVLAPNVRGSDGFGRRFAMLDDSRLRGNAVKDVKAGLDWLIQNDYTDAGRAGVAGTGYGGYLVLCSIIEYPQSLAAAWVQGGIADLAAYLENAPLWRQEPMTAEYGPLTDGPFLRSISPAYNVGRIRTPLTIVHGVNDPQVPIGQARQMVEALRTRGAVVDSLFFTDEGHEIARPEAKTALLAAMAAFFDGYLKRDTADSLRSR